MFQSIQYFLFQIEKFSLVQWLTNTNVFFEKNDKDVNIQSRKFNTSKNSIIVGLFHFIIVLNSEQVHSLLNDESLEKVNDLAIK